MLSRSWLLALLLAFGATSSRAADPQQNDVDALADWNTYVGGWKGVGQPQRGSVKGAWGEKADWAWKFEAKHASLEFLVDEGKLITTGEIKPGKKAGEFELLITTPGQDKPVSFIGKKSETGPFVFDRASDGAADTIARVTFRQVAENNRLLVLLERKTGESQFSRIAEIGYTRQGIQFAASNTGPECIVTGGAGTMAVSYMGQTYYVCCTGCKDLFDADPAGVIAEYKAKKDKKSGGGK